MEVGALVRKNPIVLKHDGTILEAVQLMAKHNVGVVPIVDAEGRPLGVISERHVLRALAAGVPLDRPALEAARRELVTVTPDANVYDALLEMRRRGVRHVLVVDRDGRLIGVLSIRDFMREDVLAYIGFQAWQPPDVGGPEIMSL
ncbi:CBS domain-containing protein [Pyrobaculum neutrophilum]|uniref:Signal-transduction protein with CBS domains n=1 Tax=Pyrobaculum neutrophilum (strain DSM 2338 / JCM 9278 / NBRC 100436 / V24Sta) TaxID=444157 RepID=B1YCP6_PYRNV|nr:CBS domain-containing protein [Pyrobaculum neutrophilum]ACB39559.1 putative signal-transduction protein with CBS domains [Pyrobaculum neutrophilum V24Sta]